MPRPKNSYDLMANVARMYYIEKMNQDQIGHIAGLSRSQVSRILKQAWDYGIIRVRIVKPPEQRINEVVDNLRTSLGLKKIAVVSSDGTQDFITRALIAEACTLLEEILHNTQDTPRTIGVSWGNTLAKFADFLQPVDRYPDVTVVPLMGGIGQASPELQVNHIAQRIAEKLGGKSLQLHAPSLVDSYETARRLLVDNSVVEVTKHWDSLTCALVGIGTPDSVGRAGYFNDKEFYECVKREVCGDVCVNFFDKEGKSVLPQYRARTLACTPDQLRQVPYSIGVAFGPQKVQAIWAAIRSGMINSLVTDLDTAEQILKIKSDIKTVSSKNLGVIGSNAQARKGETVVD